MRKAKSVNQSENTLSLAKERCMSMVVGSWQICTNHCLLSVGILHQAFNHTVEAERQHLFAAINSCDYVLHHLDIGRGRGRGDSHQKVLLAIWTHLVGQPRLIVILEVLIIGMVRQQRR